ncbi:zinc metalloprotease [Actinobacillus succinogenes]|uniref:Zinc metalloprotease n=1 Tax=Actinobacillus succinogenes (strain ATCC 55618 / DSM 22257 / CCUG 43843 / 130Z) TaxID=339671 RepID=A6VQR5_ACTSZ|nr:sigma E protease regulator RseP [Actinobacillus succinogenes]ABR75312.1 putative membrane-associated zinc metalloprotease [Actinobacillus succinogenes 130Z]PHI40298.1 zinc metalloprotease [Actinobacillus succinogenes]
MSFLWSLISFIIVICILVFVHEYGHFWAARKCGVKVHRFSIGFGKVLWRRNDKFGTEFAVSAVPLGGYVKMLDERNEEVPPELKPQAFNSKTVLQRAFIIAAGPLANFLFAVLAYWVIYAVGIPSVKPVIAEIKPNSVAAAAQLRPDSQILAVDGEDAPDWETINMLLASKLGNDSVTLTVTPFGENQPRDSVLNLRNWSFNPEKESAFRALGIQPVSNKANNVLSNVVDGSPAERAGLKVGDILLQQDGSPVIWSDLVAQIQTGRLISLQVEREGERHTVSFTPMEKDGGYFAGIAPTFEPVNEKYRTELKYDILDALKKGVEKTVQLSWLTIKVIGKLFTGDLSLNNLSGPISIAQGAGLSASIGLVYYLSFMALISVNLGVMNLFPLPVLDGGHLVFLAAEGIKGKPVSEKVQDFCYRIGAVLLLMLTVFALFNDFLRL